MNEGIIGEFFKIIIPNSSIGVYGITKSLDVKVTSRKILEVGLNHSYRGGLNSNCTLFGRVEHINFLKVLKYYYSLDQNGFYGNILVAIPNTMEDINGNCYFIGPFEDIYLGGHEDKIIKACKHPFNAWVNDRKKLIPEFLVGAYIKGPNNQSEVIINDNYIGLKSDMEQRTFFEEIKPELISFGIKNLSDDILIDSASFYHRNFLEYQEREKTLIKK